MDSSLLDNSALKDFYETEMLVGISQTINSGDELDILPHSPHPEYLHVPGGDKEIIQPGYNAPSAPILQALIINASRSEGRVRPFNIQIEDEEGKKENEEEQDLLIDSSKEEQDIPYKKSSIFSAIFNFTNSMIGSGIIALPYALSRAGFWFGILLLIIVAFLMDYGVRHLIACGIKHNRMNYESIVKHSLGDRAYYIVIIALCVGRYGAMIIYHIIIGDTIPQVIQYLFPNAVYPLHTRWFIICCFSTIFMLPLSLLKHIRYLTCTSSVSVFAVFVIIVIVIFQLPQSQTLSQNVANDSVLPIIQKNWFSAVGSMTFIFVCQQSSFIVYNSLKKPNEKRWRKVTQSSISLSLFLSLVLAVISYLFLRDTVDSNVLNNFAESNSMINIARLLLAMTMVFTYPMENFIVRHCIMQVIVAQLKNKRSSKKNLQFINFVYYLVTFCLWAICLGIGVLVNDVGGVLSFIGSLSSSIIAYILPGLVIFRANSIWSDKNQWFSFKFYISLFMIVFGAVCFVFGSIQSFL